MVPVAGELRAVAAGEVIDLLYASSPGLVEVKPPRTSLKAKPKVKKSVETKVNVKKQSEPKG